MEKTLLAGSAVTDISPTNSQFLYGYPHVERYSTGINDPLLSSALYLYDGYKPALFVASDIIFVSKESTQRIRGRIGAKTTLPPECIMISATHTHSGPMTINYLSCEVDKVVPKTDTGYVQFMEDRIVEAAIKAHGNTQPARIGLAIAEGRGVGTNRRRPDGPADPEVPVLLVQSAGGQKNIACMLVCSMHPTVLHEDSKLISADFPGYTRMYLQEHVVGADCPVLRHTGPAGNQSPRHVTKANTLDEAKRLGELLGKNVEEAIKKITFIDSASINCGHVFTELPKRTFPSVEAAQAKLDKAVTTLDTLRNTGAPRQQVRTAECDWFGAEETLTMAKAAADGRLAGAYQLAMPAEVQAITIGKWTFVGWQGEVFVEYALELKKDFANTYVISLANGELQGYIVTKEASDEGGYEASNALFGYESGKVLVDRTAELLETI